MRLLTTLALITPTLLAACGEGDDDGGGDLEVTYEILGTKVDGDGIPVWFELLSYDNFKDEKVVETKTAAGVLEKKLTYEYAKPHVEISEKEYRGDGTLAEQRTTTYVDDDHLAQIKTETYKEDGTTVESTETDVYEYVPGTTNVSKSTETVVGGKSDGEVKTSTYTYDGENRVTQEIRDYPDRTYTTTYDYATNTITEKTLEKDGNKTSEIVSTYRGISSEFGHVLLTQRDTDEDGSVVNFTNNCTDVGRRIDCKGTFVTAAGGKTIGTSEASLFLVKATRGAESFTHEEVIKSKEEKAEDSFSDTTEETDGPNAAGVRERVRKSTFNGGGSLPANTYKYVTTFDETNQNEVKTERFKNDVLETVETTTY